MNEQQLQQILTIQQAIAAAATAAVINSLLNPQQQQQQQQQASNGGTNSPNQIDTNNRTAQELLLHLQQQAAAANILQHQNDVDQQERPDSRLDSPAGTSSPANNQLDTNNQTIQNLLMQLQQQAAGVNPATAISSAPSLAALNLNLSNQIPAQMPSLPNIGSPINRALLGQNNSFLSSSPTTSGNIQQTNQLPNNKKLKRYHQPQTNQPNRSSTDATSKPHSSPKNHSAISNLAPRNNNSTGTTNSNTSSSAFLSNNVGLPRKLVRGQDVWLGRGAEQTRQILKCMWCGQSFRTLAEMTQHMKVTQHYTNIISQEQITSWKQPDSSESSATKQVGRPSNQPKNLEESLDTSSEKFNDSDREDSFSNDDEPVTQQQQQQLKSNKSRSSSVHKTGSSIKTKRESGDSRDTVESIRILKSTSKNSKHEMTDNPSGLSSQEDSDAENSSASAASTSQRKLLNSTTDALKGNDEGNKLTAAESPSEKIKAESGDERTSDSNHSEYASGHLVDTKPNFEDAKFNGDLTKSPVSSKSDEKHSDDDDNEDEHLEKDEQQRVESGDDEMRKDNNEDCDKISRKRADAKNMDLDVIKQVSEGQKGDGSGDPLSALETMVEKSFDPRMRPGLASGGILQRLGIDEEVCPPWQHINYANWYAAAAYGHPMAAALLAAGMNLQNGIKLSKNMNQKKGDE